MNSTNRSRSHSRAWRGLVLPALLGATLLLAAAACAFLTPTPEAPADSKVATQVAATLTALAPGAAEPSPTVEAPMEASAAPTSSPARPAPDELVVVYVDAGNPWLTTQSGPPRQLSEADDTVEVLISDDGARIVFLRRESVEGDTPPVEIRAVNADGSDERVLMSPDEFDALYPLDGMLHNDVASIAFIPGTHDLLLNTRAVPEGPGLLKYDDLLLLDGDSGDLTTLLPRGDGGEFVPAPDGTQLALIRPDSISLANADGSNLREDVVTYDPVITYSEFRYYAQPVWAADSRQLAAAIPSFDPLAEATTGTVWRLSLDATASQLATYSGDFYFAQVRASSLIAPDLSRVVVPRQRNGDLEIGLAPLEGGEVSPYDTGDLSWVGWAPDAQHFVYSSGAPMDLQLGQAGETPQPLTMGTELRWTAPDAYLVLSGSRGAWTLRIGQLGSAPIDLAAPEGDFIAYDFAAPNGP